ncbi:MAG TPA: hypothetical protein VFQ42_21980 [Mycobacterium sp.]|nr:hypothetical protein [Mycobacterium sp.]
MGEYWKPVNMTRREYIHPHDLNDGLKPFEWNHRESRTMRMITERWSDSDTIVFVSDNDNTIWHRNGPLGVEAPLYGDLDAKGYKRISKNGGAQ